MNFHDTELRVIRRAESMSVLEADPERYAFGTLRTVVDLCDAIALGEPIDNISDAMGRVAIDMIVLCAMLDIDLAKSLETAFNKISAKPAEVTKSFAAAQAAQNQADAASNVVFLKQE